MPGLVYTQLAWVPHRPGVSSQGLTSVHVLPSLTYPGSHAWHSALPGEMYLQMALPVHVRRCGSPAGRLHGSMALQEEPVGDS